MFRRRQADDRKRVDSVPDGRPAVAERRQIPGERFERVRRLGGRALMDESAHDTYNRLFGRGLSRVLPADHVSVEVVRQLL